VLSRRAEKRQESREKAAEQRKGSRAEKRQQSREKAAEQRKGIPGLANVTVLSA